MALLSASNLIKSYAGRKVVDEVSLEVNEGEIVGLLGPNGAGKTTSFRMMIGMITPENGRVLFDGEDVTYLPIAISLTLIGFATLLGLEMSIAYALGFVPL